MRVAVRGLLGWGLMVGLVASVGAQTKAPAGGAGTANSDAAAHAADAGLREDALREA